MNWIEEKNPIREPTFFWRPANVELGLSCYGEVGPKYEIAPDGWVEGEFRITMFLGNCGWKITDSTFPNYSSAKRFCINHCNENFRRAKAARSEVKKEELRMPPSSPKGKRAKDGYRI